METNSARVKILSSGQYGELKKRTFSGVGVLVLRNLLMQPISFFGFVFLSVFLQRWELGVFWAVSEIVSFLGYFSDVGLAAAVIQKKEEPSKEELRATFTIQQILVLLCILVALLLLPFLRSRFDFQKGHFL
jgi:O-antigen/teichoic acid export membrane protein